VADPLLALTVRHPWALAIANGWKPVENRDSYGLACWARKLVGKRIAIHASKKVPGDCADVVEALYASGLWPALPPTEREEILATAGTIIAVATLAQVVERGETFAANYSPWRTADRYAFVLSNVVKLPDPVPAKGALGFWRVPDGLSNLVHLQLPRSP
jgi:hypothetical protein